MKIISEIIVARLKSFSYPSTQAEDALFLEYFKTNRDVYQDKFLILFNTVEKVEEIDFFSHVVNEYNVYPYLITKLADQQGLSLDKGIISKNVTRISLNGSVHTQLSVVECVIKGLKGLTEYGNIDMFPCILLLPALENSDDRYYRLSIDQFSSFKDRVAEYEELWKSLISSLFSNNSLFKILKSIFSSSKAVGLSSVHSLLLRSSSSFSSGGIHYCFVLCFFLILLFIRYSSISFKVLFASRNFVLLHRILVSSMRWRSYEGI
jgi:hypothetical protein